MNNTRNFSIIAHIDHGKSTLADRMLELTGAVEKREMKDRFLDTLELEQEKGITIKLQTVRMNWKEHALNLIDTPGHVDFTYEVSRALAACESAVLLVDTTQGIQAQTISNALKAQDLGLTLIPVVNKVDLPNALVEKSKKELVDTFGFKDEEILETSGKTGKGVEALLDKIIESTPQPKGNTSNKLQALVFDSFYDSHKGVIALVRIFEGQLESAEEPLFLLGKEVQFEAMEWGYLSPKLSKTERLSAGEVGYIATGLKDIKKVHVGDTITKFEEKAVPLPGYKPPTPMVFASFFPLDSNDWNKFREAFERLTLNDAAVKFSQINHPALGSGYRCGFLGLLHMDIIKERLEREYKVSVLVASPSVPYEIKLTNGKTMILDDVTDFPDKSRIEEIREPYARVEIITPQEYMAKVMNLVKDKRGAILDTEYISNLLIKAEVPLAELITDTFDQLKAVSHGFASLDYELSGYKANDIVKLDILVNREVIDPLATMVHRDKALNLGKKMVATLKEVIPKQQFSVPVQAAIGTKVIARADIPALKKDVTAGLYGGDITRKRKKLKEQRKGKKKLRKYGKVDLPPEAFVAAVKQ